MDEFTAEVHRQRITTGVLGATSQLAQAFGGPQGFATAFKACFDACPPGSRRALNMLSAFLRLMEVFQPKSLDQLDDDDFAALVQQGRLSP